MVQLRPMLEPEFQAYLSQAIKDFAEDKVAAGNWQRDEAMSKARAAFNTFLPAGLASKDHYLYSIISAGQNVGMIWFFADYSSRQAKAFIYDFVIDKAFRRQGFASQALLALEEKVKVLEIDLVTLHVFAHNTAARKLYEQLGYTVTNLNMAKRLA